MFWQQKLDKTRGFDFCDYVNFLNQYAFQWNSNY